MLNLKKLIASIAAITVALSTVSFAATYTDVTEDSAYYEAVESLSKLGIVTGYEDGTYKPEETVTRAEMAALIARIQGYDETAKGSANTVFTDVPSSHWASGYIAQASNQQIVNGYGDGTFGPEDPVLYEQAVKMIMATLGYTPFAENNGSYPTGYLTAASRYGVTDGVSNAVIGTGANRGTIAQLLANAIDTALMGQSKWATDGTIEYTIYDGISAAYKTLMSENLGVVKLKGIITENTVTALSTSKTIDTSKAPAVKITLTDNFDTSNKDFAALYSGGVFAGYKNSGVDYLVGETDAEDYLGMSVIFYVVENTIEDMYEIISIAADSTKNDVVTFTLDQFDIIDGSGTNDVIKYYKNETDRDSSKLNLSYDSDNTRDDYSIVFNNVGMGNAGLTTIFYDGSNTPYVAGNGKCKNGGMVTLINNDADAAYDVVIVEVAATAVVKKATEEGVSFKKGVNLPDNLYNMSEIVVDADAEDEVVIFTKDGEEVDYTTLTEWDVVSVIAAGSNPKYILAEVIGTPVVGTVSASFKSDTSAGGVGYTVDGVKYDVALNAYGAGDLEVGAGGTIYVDKYGKIAAFNEDLALATGVAGNFGFVTKAIVESDAIDGQTVTVQMLTANGIETLDLATSVTFKRSNGTDGTIKPADYTLLGGATTKEQEANNFFFGNTGSTIKGAVVKYTVNSNGKINSITMADYDTDKFEDKGISSTGATAEFDADNNQFRVGATAYIDADATVFFVDFKSGGVDYDTDECLVGTVEDLEDKNTYEVVAVYADNKATDNNFVVIKGGLNQSSPTAGVAVITGVATSEVEGDTVYVIEYIANGEALEAETVPVADLAAPYNNTATAPTIGDVVKIKLNSDGKISGLAVVWNFAEGVRTSGTALSFTPGSPGTLEVFDGGYVTAYKESSEQATLNSGNTYKLSQAENVYVIDATGRDVDVRTGSSTSYRFYENLYDTAVTSTIRVNGTEHATYKNMTNGSATWTAAVQAYTDYVFVREYENKVKDVVIVKGATNVTVGSGSISQYTVTFDTTGFPNDSAAAALAAPTAITQNDATAVTLPDATVYYKADGTQAQGWTTVSTDTTGANAVTSLTLNGADVTLYLY